MRGRGLRQSTYLQSNTCITCKLLTVNKDANDLRQKKNQRTYSGQSCDVLQFHGTKRISHKYMYMYQDLW